MKRFNLTAFAVFLVLSLISCSKYTLIAQDRYLTSGSESVATAVQPARQAKEEGDDATAGTFLAAVRTAVRQAREGGAITRREAIRIRIAMYSPAFRAKAEELVLIQMAFSGEEVPITDDGRINRAAIDWSALADFLERIIPLLLDILERFL